MKTLQERLFWARNRKGVSQQEVADFIGVKQNSYSELETGRTQRSKYTPEIAHFLGVNAYWLATGKGSIEPQLDQEMATIMSTIPEDEQRMLLDLGRKFLRNNLRTLKPQDK